MNTKFYHVYGKVKTDDGEEHVVTVVGKLEQSRKPTEITEEMDVDTPNGGTVKGELKYKVKKLHRKLTLSMSICHPLDTFDEEVGVEVAKSRIKNGLVLGSIETNDVTMLTEDAIFAELMTKLNWIMDNIEDYLP